MADVAAVAADGRAGAGARVKRRETLPDTFPTTYVPFLVIYTADIVAFTVFLATVFNGCTIVAKIGSLLLSLDLTLCLSVGFLILTVGHFGFGTVFHGIVFFQLSVRYFGHPTVDTEWIDTIALGCMAANFILLILITVYLDAYIFSYTLEPLVYYYPLQQSYWFPKRRDPIIDTEADKQYLFGKEEPAEKPATGIMAVLCGVCKRVGNNWVLNKLSLTIRSGEIVTLYGHRGCGGQVILSILSGQETPEHGSVQYQNTLRKLVVSVASEVPTLGYLTVAKYLNMISDIRGVHLSESVLASILQDLGLINVQSTRLNLLSTTQRERVRVGAAFVGHPDLVLIDWPTKESLQCYKFQILRFIERMKMDKAIVITSYDAQGTEAISDQIMLLSDGYMVLCGARAPYLDSISSVFELRLWPLTGFSSEEIEEIMVVLARCDQKMKEAARLFETPNGKLRIILPIAYRERIIVCIRELEQKAIQLGIAFCEMGSPSLHDIYANACFNEKQYTMLADFDKFNSFHNKKEFNNPNWYYSKNLLRAVCAGGFLCQVVLALAFFLIFALFIFFSLQKTLYTEARLISFDAIPSDVTIHCNNCYQEDALNVKYEAVGIETDLQENTACKRCMRFAKLG
uniref:ABC transporter domain-containing protein n=1 Tax=Caenorhabditis japonica TaxID=281687 RepID=A0A8R1I691_CAEJA